MQEQTTIRVSSNLLNALKGFKEEGDSYEDIIWDFIEPHLELSEEAKREMEISIREYERGGFVTLDELKEEIGF